MFGKQDINLPTFIKETTIEYSSMITLKMSLLYYLRHRIKYKTINSNTLVIKSEIFNNLKLDAIHKNRITNMYSNIK